MEIVVFMHLSPWIPMKGPGTKHWAAIQEESSPWKPFWTLSLEREFLQGAQLVPFWTLSVEKAFLQRAQLVHRYWSEATEAVETQWGADLRVWMLWFKETCTPRAQDPLPTTLSLPRYSAIHMSPPGSKEINSELTPARATYLPKKERKSSLKV